MRRQSAALMNGRTGQGFAYVNAHCPMPIIPQALQELGNGNVSILDCSRCNHSRPGRLGFGQRLEEHQEPRHQNRVDGAYFRTASGGAGNLGRRWAERSGCPPYFTKPQQRMIGLETNKRTHHCYGAFMAIDNDSLPIHDTGLPPGKREPLSPGRTDLNLDDEPGTDELPDNDGPTPATSDENPANNGVPDIDPDNADTDDLPTSR